jgi:hypothetical protein
MRRIVFILVLCLVIQSAGIAEAIDGSTWASFNNSQKTGFVMGWISASNWVIPKFLVALTGDKELFEQISRSGPSMGRIHEKFQKTEGLDFKGVTYIQIAEVVDQIYSDPRVKQWEIGEIMPIARGRLKEGWTEKDVDEVIAYQLKMNELTARWMRGANKSEMDKAVKEIRKPRVLILLDGK